MENKIVYKMHIKGVNGIEKIEYKRPSDKKVDEIKMAFSKCRLYVFPCIIVFSFMMMVMVKTVKYIIKTYNITDCRVWIPFGIAAFIVLVCYLEFLKKFGEETVIKYEIVDDEGYSGKYVCSNIVYCNMTPENLESLNIIFKQDRRALHKIKRVARKSGISAIQILRVEGIMSTHYVLLIYSCKSDR